MKHRKLFTVIVLATALGSAALVYAFRTNLFGAYRAARQEVSQAQQIDLGTIASTFKQEIISPPPLNAGGTANAKTLLASKVIALTNIRRFNNGNLPPLVENAKLDAAAKAKANNMFAKQYFEHVSPTGVDPGKLAQSFGYDYIVEGENLILGSFSSEAEVVQDWMNSPEHRANILNDRFADIGVAMVRGDYKGQEVWIGVQEFGLPLSSCQQPDAQLKNQIDQDKQQLDAWSAQLDREQQQINQDNPNSGKYRQDVAQYNQLVDQYNQLNQTTKNLINQYNTEVNAFNACVKGTT